jgi:hypothetical protein
MSTENVTVTRHVCALAWTEGCPPDRCMTTHLLSFSFAAYEAFEDLEEREKQV